MACKWNCSTENWDGASQSIWFNNVPNLSPPFHSFLWMKSFWLAVNLLTSQHVKFEPFSDQKFLIECTLQLYPLNQITWQTHPKRIRMKNTIRFGHHWWSPVCIAWFPFHQFGLVWVIWSLCQHWNLKFEMVHFFSNMDSPVYCWTYVHRGLLSDAYC